MKTYFTLLLVTMILVGSCKKDPEPVSSDIISISMDKDTLNYGNAETANITVRLNQYKANTIVEITITGGTIDGEKKIEWPITAKQNENDDSKYIGVVEKILVPASAIGNFTITAKIKNQIYSATKQYTIINSPVSNILSLQLINTTTILADNLSVYSIEATITNHQASTITFHTNQGKFVDNGQQEINVSTVGGFASADLVIGQEVTPYYIKATVVNPDYTKSISFTPQRALPELIYLTSNSSVIDSSSVSQVSSSVNFTTFLSRNFGKVSINQPVNAEAFQLPGGIKTSYGTFYNYPFLSNQNESTTINYFTSPGLDKNLPLFVVFRTNGSSGIISDTLMLDVN